MLMNLFGGFFESSSESLATNLLSVITHLQEITDSPQSLLLQIRHYLLIFEVPVSWHQPFPDKTLLLCLDIPHSFPI